MVMTLILVLLFLTQVGVDDSPGSCSVVRQHHRVRTGLARVPGEVIRFTPSVYLVPGTVLNNHPIPLHVLHQPVPLYSTCQCTQDCSLEPQVCQDSAAVVSISTPYLRQGVTIFIVLKCITLYWSVLLWIESSSGNSSTTVTWSRQTSPTHSTGCMSYCSQ